MLPVQASSLVGVHDELAPSLGERDFARAEVGNARDGRYRVEWYLSPHISDYILKTYAYRASRIPACLLETPLKKPPPTAYIALAIVACAFTS